MVHETTSLVTRINLLIVATASFVGCTSIFGIDKDYREVAPSGTGTSSGDGGQGATTQSAGGSGGHGGPGGGGQGGGSANSGAGGSGGEGQGGGAGGSGAGGGEGGGMGGGLICQPFTQVACYTGPDGTQGIGTCMAGTKACNAQGSGYGACEREVTPDVEKCDTPDDDDCDGTNIDSDVGCVCVPGTTIPCYSGAPGTKGIGQCKGGTAACDAQGMGYESCAGETLPALDDCLTPADEDCDSIVTPCIGASLWSRRFGDAGLQTLKSISASNTSASVLMGYFSGSVDFGGATSKLTSAGLSDVFLTTFDANGQAVWSKSFGDAGTQEGHAVATDSNGNIFTTGLFSGTINLGGATLTSGGSADVFLAKLDPAGNHSWSNSFGGIGNQSGDGVAVDPSSGGVVITGQFASSINLGCGAMTSAGNDDIYLAKLSAAGMCEFSKRFGNAAQQQGVGVAVDGSQNIIAGGSFFGVADFGGGNLVSGAGAGGKDVYVAKFDSAGIYLWGQRFGDASDQALNAIVVNSMGNIFVVGQFAGMIDFGNGILTSAGGNDVFVAAFNGLGAPLWSKSFGGAGEDVGRAVAVSSGNSVVITGEFSGAVDFGGGTLTSAGGLDAFVLQLDGSGVHIWSKRFGNNLDQRGSSVVFDLLSNVVFGGTFAGTIDFGMGALSSAGLDDVFLAKLFQ